jgi:isoleucyl-tRNA synthetase
MSDNVVNYKDTINLPKTDFPMKGNLNQREPEFIESWLTNKIYFKMVEQNSEKGNFAMPDGPPYANGHIHVGHALNKILKDTVIKYKNMNGYKAPFIPGWDCHGLPIELGVTKAIGDKKNSLTDKQFRDLCREEAKKWVSIQREEFKRIGVMADWENPYMTLQPDYEAEEVRVLAKILKTGAFYHGTKPVYWCWALKTALAEAEVEYQNHRSHAIYVKFELLKHLDVPNKNKTTNLVIWTTTPWTIPANLAVSAHPEFDYEVYETDKDYLVIAQGLKEAFEKDTGITLKSLSSPKVIKGLDLENLEYKHPFIDRVGKVLLGTHVTLEAGTGLVHTAPGHGVDDYNVGMRYHLPIFSPVDAGGFYTDEVPDYLVGKHVLKEGNKIVLEVIQKSGHLLSHKEIEHSYPHCWRSKAPLIYRATPQWFLKMDLKNKDTDHTIREKSLNAIKEVNWVPSWGEKRISSMIENRPDWCLSRQRLWGVPIPVLYCKSCNHPLAKEDVMLRMADAMDKTATKDGGGIEGYFDTDVKIFAGNHKCEKCGKADFEKGKDILDVWFDSGVCFAAVQKKRDGLSQPADLYLEGSDQHRGWFHTSLLASVAAEGIAPFKTVLTHGFVMFSKGQKMSKSLGNVVDPMDVIKNSGSDILRLWATHEDYANDLSCNPEGIARITETYRRLRNTIRFLLGNISDYDSKKDAIPYKDLTDLDKWALAKLNSLIENVTEAFDKYEFYKIYHLINNFVTVDLSAFYLDILKDRLYIRKTNGHLRRSAQTALYEITTRLTVMMAPIISFLAEETYSFTQGKQKESVFLEKFPLPNKAWVNPEVIKTFEVFQKIRTEALKQLEELRKNKTIGAGLEGQLIITADGEELKVLELLKDSLLEFFIVSQVHLKKGAFSIEAKKADGEKCIRCWTYNTNLKSSPKHVGICPKCVEALT